MAQEEQTSPEQAADPVPEEELAKEVAAVSPEGKPADPQVGMRQFAKFWLVLALAVMVLGLILGLAWEPVVGIVVAVVGLVSLIVNPEVLAGILRAKDHEKAADRHNGR